MLKSKLFYAIVCISLFLGVFLFVLNIETAELRNKANDYNYDTKTVQEIELKENEFKLG